MKRVIGSFMFLTLVACGGEKPTASDANTNGDVDTAAAANPNAEGTAAKEGINCAVIAKPAANSPDALGVSLKMTYDDAYKTVACADPSMVVTVGGEPGQRLISGEGDKDSISVKLLGALGDDRVIEVNRVVKVEQGKEPAIANLRKLLTDKYGALLTTQGADSNSGSYVVNVIKTTDGQAVGEGSPMIDKCLYYGDRTPNCGFAMAANMVRLPTNPELTSNFNVVIQDLAYTATQRAAFEASASKSDANRRANEVQQSSANNPQL